MSRRYRFSYRDYWFRRAFWWLVPCAIILLVRFLTLSDQALPTEPMPEGLYEVAYVIDGDTFRLPSNVRVRLQGINTPELASQSEWAVAAQKYSETFVEQAGGKVLLTFGAERLDRYGRLLAFVWNGDRLLNEELVRNGLAEAKLQYRYAGRFKRRFAAAEKFARQQQSGIWSEQ